MPNCITPIYEIRYASRSETLSDDSKNLTPNFQIFLKSIKLVDEIEGAADKLRIQIADPCDSFVPVPPIGGKLRIKLGYKGSNLKRYGDFTVEDAEYIGAPNTYELTCTSIDYSSNLYIKRTAYYEDLTVEGLALLITLREEYANLNLKYDVRLEASGILHEHIAQTNESDLHLLKRMAEKEGADFTIKNNTFTIIDRNKTGYKKAPSVLINPKEATRYFVDQNNRNNYSKVIAKWWDPKEAELKILEYSAKDENGVPVEGGVSYIIQEVFQDTEHATAVARGQFQNLKRKQKFGQMTIPGRTDIFPGTVIELAGDTVQTKNFRRMLAKKKNETKEDKEFAVTQVVHTMDSKGWKMDLRLEGII
jgi:uncharacterized protein